MLWQRALVKSVNPNSGVDPKKHIGRLMWVTNDIKYIGPVYVLKENGNEEKIDSNRDLFVITNFIPPYPYTYQTHHKCNLEMLPIFIEHVDYIDWDEWLELPIPTHEDILKEMKKYENQGAY